MEIREVQEAATSWLHSWWFQHKVWHDCKTTFIPWYPPEYKPKEDVTREISKVPRSRDKLVTYLNGYTNSLSLILELPRT